MTERKIFGTDGIRGIANLHPMTAELILNAGKAIACYLGKDKGRTKIIIGKDTRLSGYMIESALTAGICSMGADVLLVGPMPTPAIAHLTKSLNADAGIVISASHNPAQDNGIKIFDSEGFKLPDKDEQEIEKLIVSTGPKCDHVKGDLIGKAYRIDDAQGRYIEFAKSTVKSMSLKGLKIVLDCANGAAYKIAPKIFSELGAEIIVLNDKPDGLNINLNCGALHPEIIKEAVIKNKADIGIALDGDADRVIVCDEKGENINGDHILAACAIDLDKRGKLSHSTVVSTVMANIGFEKAMIENSIKVLKTKVGDRYVIEEMKKGGYALGGEQSGHIIFTDFTTTGDGIITALQLLRIMKRENKKLSEVSKEMESFPQVLVNVKVKEKKDFAKIPGYEKKIEEIRKKLSENSRILVRYSGTENIARIMIEGENKAMIEECADGIAALIKKELGER